MSLELDEVLKTNRFLIFVGHEKSGTYEALYRAAELHKANRSCSAATWRLEIVDSWLSNGSTVVARHLGYELHPVEIRTQMRSILNRLEGAYEGYKPSRLYASCNLPHLVDLVPADKVVCCNNLKYDLLSNHPEFQQWKNNMRTGEFWESVGEEWVK